MPTTRDELTRKADEGDKAALLALADALDAEGRHSDAIATLSRAASQGSAAAKGKVGARILIGDRAPTLPVQGANLVAEAANEGDPAAAALLATLLAAGFHCDQDWEQALDWLQRSAERGFPPAQGQLAVLSGEPALSRAVPADGGREGADVWRRLRGSVDVSALTTPPVGRTLHEDPLIRAFRGFASKETCEWLIARAGGRLKRATVYDSVRGEDRESETRTNTTAIFSLVDTDLVQLFALARMAPATGVPMSHIEAPGLLHYAEGEEISEHYDFIDPNTPDYEQQIARDGQRIITFLIYLNDDYEGGETDFPRLGVRHRGELGEGLFFSNALASGEADVRTLHAGRPPKGGEKWIVSQFIRNRPAMPGHAPT